MSLAAFSFIALCRDVDIFRLASLVRVTSSFSESHTQLFRLRPGKIRTLSLPYPRYQASQGRERVWTVISSMAVEQLRGIYKVNKVNATRHAFLLARRPCYPELGR